MLSLKQYIAEKFVGTKIFEMAKSLDDYKRQLEYMLVPIISHIILILKSREENDDEFINHWKSEIKGFLVPFTSFKLKTKNNYNTRLKHINSVFIDDNEIDTDDDWFKSNLWKKLYEEGYDLLDRDTYNNFLPIIHDFQDNYLDELIDVIASKNINKLEEYINKL